MNGAFYVGAAGLQAQARALEVIANNVANINTVGFKRSAVRFSELVTPATVGDQDTAALAVASPGGVAVSGTGRVWTEGELQPTGQPLDIAIDGPGFIELLGPSGRSLLWRGGTLKVNEDGYLASADGAPLKAMISVPLDAHGLVIGRDGVVSTTDGDGAAHQLGQIDIVMVKDVDGLMEAGNGSYEVRDPANAYAVQPGEAGAPSIAQGALESANVRLADEMTALLLTQRAFAANAQIVQAGDQLMSIVNGLRR